jgi:hypothetical protein
MCLSLGKVVHVYTTNKTRIREEEMGKKDVNGADVGRIGMGCTTVNLVASVEEEEAGSAVPGRDLR